MAQGVRWVQTPVLQKKMTWPSLPANPRGAWGTSLVNTHLCSYLLRVEERVLLLLIKSTHIHTIMYCLAELEALKTILIMAKTHENHFNCSPHFTQKETEGQWRGLPWSQHRQTGWDWGLRLRVLPSTQYSFLFPVTGACIHVHYLPCTWNTKLQP
jgi:hypothetical protein